MSNVDPTNRGYIEVVKSKTIRKKFLNSHMTIKYRPHKEQDSPGDLKEQLERREHMQNDSENQNEKIAPIPSLDQVQDAKELKSNEDETEEVVEVLPLDRDDSESSEYSSSDEDEDEMEELQRELEKLKKERNEEKIRKEQERIAQEAEEYRTKMSESNELLIEAENRVKKKWFEETIFRNQSRFEPKYQKKFTNDTIRNEFHQRFLNKYVR